MIRYDGYYLTDGILFEERRDSAHEWYSFTAYLFYENGSFIRATKFCQDKHFVSFESSEFKSENTDSFEVSEEELVFYLNKGKSWETTEYLKRISSERFVMKNERVISFKPWREQ